MSALIEVVLLLLTPTVPLVLAVALLLRPGAAIIEALIAWSALPALVIAVLMPPGLAATVPWVLGGSEVGLDDTGRTFLLFSALLWLAAGVAARHWIGTRRRHFFVFFALVMAGNLGLVIARDLLAFYLFYSLMSFASYGLVVHDLEQHRHAGRVYMIFVVVGDMALFAALALIAAATAGELSFEAARAALPLAPQQDLIVALLVLGFGVKVGVLGLHVTLPLIYAAAPTAAGIVLAGALINAGLLGWLRLLPVAAGTLAGWAPGLMSAGLAAAFYGALVGSLQHRPRVVLAYSSISQMGILTAGVGAALAASDPEATLLAALTLYALHHALAKGALFMGVGIVERGAGRSPLVIAALALPALAIAGAPFTSGMLAKETLKKAFAVAPQPWQGTLETLLPWTAVATTVVLARFLWLLLRELPQGPPPWRSAPFVTWLVLVGLVLSLAWIVGRDPAANGHLWTAAVIWEVTWPVLLGGGLAFAVARAAAATPLPTVPPGDVLVVLVALGRSGLRAWRVLVLDLLPRSGSALWRGSRRVSTALAGWRALDTLEAWLVEGPVAGALAVAMILALWLLLGAT